MTKRFFWVFLAIPLAVQAASYTVSKSMIGSSGSFTTAGFTDPAFTYSTTGTVVAGFSANIPTNITALSNGGITNTFCASFIFKNTDTNAIVNLYLNSTATQTQAVVQPAHSVCIDGSPANLWANLSGFANTNAVPSNNLALVSWAFVDK